MQTTSKKGVFVCVFFKGVSKAKRFVSAQNVSGKLKGVSEADKLKHRNSLLILSSCSLVLFTLEGTVQLKMA